MSDLIETTVEFPYVRSLGPVVGRFTAALGQRRLTGVRAGDRVLVPPVEYDPATGEELDGTLVDVGPAGTVRSWTWVAEPSRHHPMDRPFAFALIQPDGADTALVHLVDAGEPGAMSTGMRVLPRWADTPAGRLGDLACFVPAGADEAAAQAAAPRPDSVRTQPEPVATTDFPSSLRYRRAIDAPGVRYVQALGQGTIIGQRCPQCHLVYTPPRDICPVDGIAIDVSQDLALPDRGVVTNFTIVTPVPYPGQQETEPFARVSVLLDEVDALVGLQSLVGVANDDVRVGMRVEAVWLPPSQRRDTAPDTYGGALDGHIRGWRPTAEPDLPAEDYVERVF